MRKLWLCAILLTAGCATTETRIPSGIQIENMGSSAGIAPANVRPITPIGLELLKTFEGWGPKPYDTDGAGFCTVGYGHLIARAKCNTINPLPYAEGLSRQQGSSLLSADSLKAQAAVQRLVRVEINEDQFSALTSFVFNLGADALKNSTLLEYLNENKQDLAARQFTRWVHANNKRLQGLVDRRACERDLFLSNLELNTANMFDRKACSTYGIASTDGPPIDVLIGESR